MEDIYCFNQDCIIELSYLIFNDKILLSLSISLKAIRTCFFFRHTLIPTAQCDISKFTSVQELDLSNTIQLVDFTFFRYLERLTLPRCIHKLNFYNCSKLTYLDCNKDQLDVNFVNCINLKHLKCFYTKNVESLIHLQSLICKFENLNHIILDFSSFCCLTKLHLINNTEYQKIMIPFSTVLIDLLASHVDFLNRQILGDGLKYLNLRNVQNILFSNLMSVKSIHFDKIKNINISNQGNVLDMYDMTNLTSFDISECDEFENMKLSTSLQRLNMNWNTKNSIDISNLTRLTYLHYSNCCRDDGMHEFSLPKNIVNFHLTNKSTRSSNIQANIITEQICEMKYLQKLYLIKLSFDRSKFDKMNQESVTRLVLFNCKFKSLNNFVNLKHLTCEDTDFHNMNMISFSSLIKLTIKHSKNFDRIYFSELKNLQTLKLINSGQNLNFDNVKFTNLIIYSQNVKINQCNNLKRFQIDNSDLFFKLLREGFPLMLKDIYVKLNEQSDRYLSKLYMKNINLHFIE